MLSEVWVVGVAAQLQSFGGVRFLVLDELLRLLAGGPLSACGPLRALPLSFPNRRSMFYSPTVHYYSLHINVSYYSFVEMIFAE